MTTENIEEQIKQKAAEFETLLNKAPVGTSAYIETTSFFRMEDDYPRNVFSIRIAFERGIYP